jgi:two-component system, LuxR family, sensor kinase FixL
MNGTPPDAVIVIDEEGCIRWFSPEAETLFGHVEAELLNRPADLLLPAPRKTAGSEYPGPHLAHALAPGECRILAGRRKDGGTFPMEVTVLDIRRSRDRLFTVGIRELASGLDRERRLEEQLAALIQVARAGELDDLASMLSDVANRPLAQVSRYLASDAHLSRTGDLVAARQAMASIAVASARISAITPRLRDLLRRNPAERRIETVRDIIETACGLALTGTQNDLTLTIRIAEDAREAVVDRNQIQRVLLNLIRNAEQAMTAPASRDVTITAARDGGMVEIRVTDSGPGIPDEIRPRLFHPFAATRPGGMGIGLSYCRVVVEAHGGRIAAQDGEDGGAVLRFTVPHPSAETMVLRGDVWDDAGTASAGVAPDESAIDVSGRNNMQRSRSDNRGRDEAAP